ncbi:transcriptional regulator with XRE-family HTH domain [Streptosporangium brasiliense]|uniref:Transcriptional regulator with XRE-family HTH domain n=2 Tax=Streptosporangiaceae TaxID=2004 RepID=A0ABT9RNE4_9ACTN|nr:transcriptional regulator with XRE-family HTH domain [Streptosporangium brasiliense]
MTREDVAEQLDCAPATVTKFENATAAVSVATVAMLMEIYGVAGPARDDMLKLAREARQRGWWHQYSRAIPAWFSVYVGLEEAASEISSWHPEVLDGRLQTESYMRALISAELPVPDASEIDRRVAVRLKRQERLHESEPLSLWVVIGEAALRRLVGGPETMREQLEHLVQQSLLNNVTIQVLPYKTGAYPGMHGGFHLLRFPEATGDAIVYVEYQQGSIYLEKKPDVASYDRLFDHLVARALGPDESRAMITQVAEEYS